MLLIRFVDTAICVYRARCLLLLRPGICLYLFKVISKLITDYNYVPRVYYYDYYYQVLIISSDSLPAYRMGLNVC
jgi:hypothetical protein